jgi:hypothetical protein
MESAFSNPHLVINAGEPFFHRTPLNYLMMHAYNHKEASLIEPPDRKIEFEQYVEAVARLLIAKGARVFTSKSGPEWLHADPVHEENGEVMRLFKNNMVLLLSKLYKEKNINFFTMESPNGETFLKNYFFDQSWSASDLRLFLKHHEEDVYEGLYKTSAITDLVHHMMRTMAFSHTNRIHQDFAEDSYIFLHKLAQFFCQHGLFNPINPAYSIQIGRLLQQGISVDIQNPINGNSLLHAALQIVRSPKIKSKLDNSACTYFIDTLMKHKPNLLLINNAGESAATECWDIVNDPAYKPGSTPWLSPVAAQLATKIRKFYGHLLMCHHALATNSTAVHNEQVEHAPDSMLVDQEALQVSPTTFASLPIEVVYYITSYLNRFEFTLPTSDTPPTVLQKLDSTIIKKETAHDKK